ncbi:LytTR family DNA-binding domain-containing protein [Rhodoferax sp. GW822-FHT02A01]|uniref:LytR/AlgR family response regulator transcription factor n=1 Tax=Rhodoferax sp. GW822-FHT02A01 TaxID=3141537 RepID=UPI00315C76B1
MSGSQAAEPVLRVLVVDDESLARARLRTLLEDCRHPPAVMQAQAANAVQAMECLQHQPFDVVLLDIHMPGADGLSLAQVIMALPQPPALIFVTAHAEHAVQAFELDATDYLTKPVRLERLEAALQKAVRFNQARGASPPAQNVQDVLIIQDRNRTERVPLGEVVYFKAELKYVTVRTRSRNFILDGSLNELEEKYRDQFLRIHRNALIAKHAARALEKHHDPEEGEGWAVRMDGVSELLFVSRRQLAAVKEMLARG